MVLVFREDCHAGMYGDSGLRDCELEGHCATMAGGVHLGHRDAADTGGKENVSSRKFP